MTTLHDNQWTRPIRKGYRLECCQCGLTHAMDFKLVRVGKTHAIEFRARRVRTRKSVKKL